VPFGSRQLPGIVVALSQTSPVAESRDILGIIDQRPVLTPYQLELMQWISQYYCAPLHMVAWSMFPSGISWQAESVLYLEDNAGSVTSPSKEEYRILALLRERGPLTQTRAKRMLKMKRFGQVLGQMMRKGWVRREIQVRGPQVKPKTEVVVRLASPVGEDTVASLSRAPRQRAVLAYLAEWTRKQSDPDSAAIPLLQLCKEVGVARSIVDNLARRGLLTIVQHEVRRDPLAGREFVSTEPPKFTPDQEAAWQSIAAVLDLATSHVFLLHGVTGSGKTEIYLRALAEVLKRGGQGIVLVPEISLTPQTIRRFAARFPGRLAVLHSKLSEGERYDEWRRIREGLADVVIGPRSAVFAPLPRLRLIVLDEEHEWTYKQQDMPPLYHAREVALKLAELTGALVILGSATPDVASYYRAQRGVYTLLRLPQRIMGHQRSIEQQKQDYGIAAQQTQVKTLGPGYEDARYMDLPPVEVVDLRAELRAGNRSMFSRALQRAMQQALTAHEQVILFLNRRGAASFIMCRDCGHVIRCSRCDVSLTYHADREELLCHHCNRRVTLPSVCPQCSSKRIKFFGVGTQALEQAVRELFPQARVLRWDRDVTGGKDAHEIILDRFVRHQADVLIGTQMIAKGLDLPLVTLVGVVTADTALQLPDFRASERTFQILTQVAGRAGRSILGGKVIIQTYTPQHFCIQAASRHDYEGFYRQELEFRRQQGYPPFKRLVRLLFTNPNAQKCEDEARKLHHRLEDAIARWGVADVDLIGPAPCFIERIRGQYRWQIVLRGSDPTVILEELLLPQGWRVDVDPVNLL
jgi:primosomal protein N' (replication factor Y)